jgi:hypothetical protein
MQEKITEEVKEEVIDIANKFYHSMPSIKDVKTIFSQSIKLEVPTIPILEAKPEKE